MTDQREALREVRDALIGKVDFLLEGPDTASMVLRKAIIRYIDEAFAALPTTPQLREALTMHSPAWSNTGAMCYCGWNRDGNGPGLWADHILAALPSTPQEGLDAAWAEAEAALTVKFPRGFHGPSLWHEDKGWCAAGVEHSLLRPMPVTTKGHPTPAAALRALAARLAPPPPEPTE